MITNSTNTKIISNFIFVTRPLFKANLNGTPRSKNSSEKKIPHVKG